MDRMKLRRFRYFRFCGRQFSPQIAISAHLTTNSPQNPRRAMLTKYIQSQDISCVSSPATNNTCSSESWFFDWSQFPPAIEETSNKYYSRYNSVDAKEAKSPFVNTEEHPPVLSKRCASEPSLIPQEETLVPSPATLQRGSSSSSHKKKVSFAPILTIRTHPVELTDHPCCRGGMALQLSWDHDEPELCDLDIFETHSPKRRSHELRLNYSSRRERLQECTGLSGAELLRLEYEIVCGVPLSRSPSSYALS